MCHLALMDGIETKFTTVQSYQIRKIHESDGCRENFEKISLPTVTILFLFAFLNLILEEQML
jgi:hypothetical protein